MCVEVNLVSGFMLLSRLTIMFYASRSETLNPWCEKEQNILVVWLKTIITVMMIIIPFVYQTACTFQFLHVTKMSILKREIDTLHTVLIFFVFCQSSISETFFFRWLSLIFFNIHSTCYIYDHFVTSKTSRSQFYMWIGLPHLELANEN